MVLARIVPADEFDEDTLSIYFDEEPYPTIRADAAPEELPVAFIPQTHPQFRVPVLGEVS